MVAVRGSDPPLTDFTAWIWMGRPFPDWGSLEATGEEDDDDRRGA
jgi:hypothetical protein